MAHESERVGEYILWLARDSSLTPMQLLKLTFLAHGWMLGIYGKPLITDAVEAWRYGPVIPCLYHRYKRFGGRAITDVPGQRPAGFSAEEENILQQVWDVYGQYGGLQLSALTHKSGTPWDVTYGSSGSGCIISDDIIREYYRQLASGS